MGNFGDELFLKTFKQIFSEDQVFYYSAYLDLSKIDAVIIGGGDLIIPYRIYEYYFPAPLKDHPIWIYGVGVIDWYPEETWPVEEIARNRDYLSRAKQLSLRDQRSASIAKKYQFNDQIRVVPDIAFAYREPKYPLAGFSRTKPSIGICVYAYESFPIEKMGEVFSDLTRQGFHLVLIPVVNQFDSAYADSKMCLAVGEEIKKRHPQAAVTVLWGQYDLEMTYNYLQSVDYLLTFKMHPIIAAVRGGVPVLAFSKMNKVSSLLEMLGLAEFLCNPDLPADEIKAKVNWFLGQGKEKMNQVKDWITSLEQESMRCLLELKNDIRALAK